MTRRKLRPEELDLWRQVTRTTDPLHPERQLTASGQETPEWIPDRETGKKDRSEKALPDFQIGEKSGRGGAGSLPMPRTHLSMDKKAFTKLRRGKLVPEGRIDLHGMTLEKAHPALIAFILRSFSDGKRLVLVITGKGRAGPDTGPIPARPGVLRHNVPQWLTRPPLSGMLLQITEAHARHGGAGAYYVYLRRSRQ
ncbi:Smr/MutS family protein [Roseovarius sp. TE539]|uniref:Smr/MutS family protein n=1 Tax=Roseovarius sp. TE539 TaxID=2249812 RepID=UPI0026B47862